MARNDQQRPSVPPGNYKPGAKDWKDNIYTGPGMPSEEAQRKVRYREKVSAWDELVSIAGLPVALIGIGIGVGAFLWMAITFLRGGLQALGH